MTPSQHESPKDMKFEFNINDKDPDWIMAKKAYELGAEIYGKYHKNNVGLKGNRSKQQCLIFTFSELIKEIKK